jgi:ubiquinone/menaquinone biosynthesis C-methylase UbiE
MAMRWALPVPDNAYDAATMALVIFFVPHPAKGVAEMVRVVRPGGMIAAYAWDIPGGGFPLEPIRIEMRAIGLTPRDPPSIEACRIETIGKLWSAAGLEAVETREIEVQRTFADFEDFWTTSLLGSSIAPTIAAMAPEDLEQLKMRVRARMPADSAGRISCDARANAIKGWAPR